MRAILFFTSVAMLTSGCSTLDQSFRLGAATGAVAGASATYAAERASGRQPTFEDVGIGASIGLGIGLLTSYFVHQSVVEDRESSTRHTEIYFGDLPPSPFVIPGSNNKRGAR